MVPQLRKDRAKVENMQKKVTGRTKVIEEFLYKKLMDRLGLWERQDLEG